MRTVGVEEELLLVDAGTGAPVSVAPAVLRQEGSGHGHHEGEQPGGTLDSELKQEQVETDTHPHTDLAAVAEELWAWRRHVDASARESGARLAALATSPVPATPRTTPTERYLRMAEHFGLTQHEQLANGCHVHVSIDSPEEGVAVLDRIRVWLPVLTALSANSPYWQGADSLYGSFRSQAWGRWPMAGPIDVQESVERYRALIDEMLATGVVLDEDMVYFDARLARGYPTIELRVADVCLYVEDAVLIAGLARALVETAVEEWRTGRAPASTPTSLLRLARWRAARSGLTDVLVHPLDNRPRPAGEVVAALFEHVRPALDAAGDQEQVRMLLAQVQQRGTGSHRQRQVFERTGRLSAVALDAADVTC
jgi:carboxylate-amine ligase